MYLWLLLLRPCDLAKLKRLLSKRSMKAREWQLTFLVGSLLPPPLDIECTLSGILSVLRLWPDSWIICSRCEIAGESSVTLAAWLRSLTGVSNCWALSVLGDGLLDASYSKLTFHFELAKDCARIINGWSCLEYVYE